MKRENKNFLKGGVTFSSDQETGKRMAHNLRIEIAEMEVHR